MDTVRLANDEAITLSQAKKLVQCMAHEQSFLFLSPPGVGKSDVVRRGLLALERELLDPDVHPALRLIGIATERPGVEAADAGREHDRLLADGEESRWNPPTRSSSRKATKTAAKRRAR